MHHVSYVFWTNKGCVRRLCAVARLAGFSAKHFSKKSARGSAIDADMLYLSDTCMKSHIRYVTARLGKFFFLLWSSFLVCWISLVGSVGRSVGRSVGSLGRSVGRLLLYFLFERSQLVSYFFLLTVRSLVYHSLIATHFPLSRRARGLRAQKFTRESL